MKLENVAPFLDGVADFTVGIPGRLLGRDVTEAKQLVDYRPVFSPETSLSNDEASEFIRKAIEGQEPCFIGRFGSTELRVVLRAHGRKNRNRFQKIYALIARAEAPLWVEWEHRRVQTHSGFYPTTEAATRRFVKLMYGAMSKLDLLGSWVAGENQLSHLFEQSKITSLDSLSPLGSNQPWTAALEGKKVVVVHPFADSITEQFQRRKLLFPSPSFLPDFELRVVKAVQSLGTPPREFPTWFDGLEHLRREVLAKDYDVAILGCGSYGFPLGSLLKDAGGKAIVLGGITQLLFGIKGRRWDNDGLYNEHWVRPAPNERPDGFRGADGGAYW